MNVSKSFWHIKCLSHAGWPESHIQFPVLDSEKMFINLRSGSTIDFHKNLRSRERLTFAKSVLYRHRLLAACITVILSVSTLDTYLVYFFKHVIVEFERNPICLALIKFNL